MTTRQRFSPVNPPSTAMSFQKDDDRGRDSAMLDGTKKVKPHGKGGSHWPITPRKLQKALTLEPKLSFGRASSC
jgi:hypothetical protein